MPHFMCEACRTGLYSAAEQADVTDPRCPSCGASTISVPLAPAPAPPNRLELIG